VGDTSGSVAFAALETEPVQASSPAQVVAAPAAEAADGPAGSRAAFTGCGPPARASAAPGPLEAVETDRTLQPPVAPVQDAVPSDVRVSAPSDAVVLVRTDPVQDVPGAHASEAFAVAVDDGPVAGWPGSGSPVFGSVATKSFALDAAELAVPAHPPSVTMHSVDAEVPRASGVTAVSRALVAEVAVPPHSVAAPVHSTEAVAFDTLTGPDTGTTPATISPGVGSRSDTSVSTAVEQVPPAPRAEQDEVPVLSRTPITSPEAAPVVVLLPVPEHSWVAQTTPDPAALVA
jgi:hypothetical protein